MNLTLPRRPGLLAGLTCPGACPGPADGVLLPGLTVASVAHDATSVLTQDSEVMVRHSSSQVDRRSLGDM